ncbi:uncharacterized protein si:ch211-57n23.1 [Notolabrus celidotus]|uniref:uncharacterized protein si:ch211-57n23.1 n=1 Tax=Notolabrus celidotus TaxID=1203425 RepID=UPI00148FFE1C|nr:uncharacterized protein si:ch211-57n23.1 [Notolabrus celidotus]XP_034561047.1 uncharacterized protein si:ch211-57n23.1 [Notolabrus celidotus]
MLQGAVSRAMLCLLMVVSFSSEGAAAPPSSPFPPEQESGKPHFEDMDGWGSGSSLLHLLHSFPADSPFITETPENSVNCSQRFWLPPSSGICWENIAGPEEFARSRLLVLQNRAALQAVSTSSGVEDSGISYEHQAREEVQGIQSDHLSVVETVQTMEKVFLSLEEKRKEGKDQGALTSLKMNLANTRDAIEGREHSANVLEDHFSTLENNLLNMQLRLNRLIQQ